MLDERVKQWTKEWKQHGKLEGNIEGKIEGRQEEAAQLLRHLLSFASARCLSAPEPESTRPIGSAWKPGHFAFSTP